MAKVKHLQVDVISINYSASRVRAQLSQSLYRQPYSNIMREWDHFFIRRVVSLARIYISDLPSTRSGLSACTVHKIDYKGSVLYSTSGIARYEHTSISPCSVLLYIISLLLQRFRA